MGAAAVSLLTALEQLITPILGDADYRRWQQETVARLGRANATDVDAIWIDRERTLAAIVEQVNPALVDRAAEFSRALSMYQFEQEDLVRAVAEKPVLTLQYDYKRPNELLPTSTARLIFDKGFGDHWSLAANGAVEIYDRRPPSDIPGAGRIRDAQLGVEVQRDLGAFALVGAAALSGTYYFQYQNSPSILKVSPAAPLAGIAFTRLPSSAAFVFVDTTHLHVAQIRLVLGPPSSSARFPIAVSYSNRTELIARSVVRAQFGVSYDFDSLFARWLQLATTEDTGDAEGNPAPHEIGFFLLSSVSPVVESLRQPAREESLHRSGIVSRHAHTVDCPRAACRGRARRRRASRAGALVRSHHQERPHRRRNRQPVVSRGPGDSRRHDRAHRATD